MFVDITVIETIAPRRLSDSLLIAGFLAFWIVGCGDNSKIPVYPVRGTVLYRGEPAEGALVIFHPVDPSTNLKEKIPPRPSGLVDSEGAFVLTTHQPTDGGRSGDYQISIVWFNEAVEKEGGLGQGDSEHGPKPKDKLNGKYADPKRSGLTATITAGTNDLEPFDLE
jgi:hypothetical protein